MTEIREPRQLTPNTTVSQDQFYEGLNKAFPSTSDVSEAAYDLSKVDSTLSAINRMTEMSRIEAQESPILPPEELNKEYPGLPQPFTRPTKRAVADEIWKRHKERVDLSQVVSNAEDSLLTGAATLGASLLPHAIDPVNILADLTIGGAIMSIGRGAMGAKAVLSARQVLSRGAAEGVLGNLATEPVTFAANQAELQDYTAAQAFVNITAGGVFFPAARFGLSKTGSFLKRLGPNHVEAVGQASVAQVAGGRRVNVDPLVGDFRAEAGGSPRWAPEYRFAPDPNVKGRTLYAGTSHQYPDIKSHTVLIDEDFGDGIYLSDSPGVANGISSRKLGKSGKVLEVKLGDTNIIDLDAPLSPNAKAALEPILEKVLGKKKLAEFEARPGKEIFDELREAVELGKASDEVVAEVNRGLEAVGFDGYRYETGKRGGDASNGVMLFNDSKSTVAREIKPDMSAVRKSSDGQLQEVVDRNQDWRSDTTYDDAAYKDFKEMADVPVEPETAQIQRLADDAIDDLDQMKKINLLTESEIKELEQIKKFKAEEATREQLIKSAFVCVG